MDMFVKVNKTRVLLLSLLAFVLLSACSNPVPATTPKEPLVPPDRIDLVYFYDSKICQCQIAPGERIQSTLFINFSGELASGKLTYQSIDLNDANNAATANKYGATSQSLFINVVRGDAEHIIAVPEIMLVKDDEPALDRLINSRIRQTLDGKE